jgi:Protein of unknown function (DUF3108)
MQSSAIQADSKPATTPVKPLFGLTAAVLLLHVAVLQGASITLHAPTRVATLAFATRAIAAQPVPAESAAPPVAMAVDAAPVQNRRALPIHPSTALAGPAMTPPAESTAAAVLDPVLEEKVAENGVQQAQSATNNIASESPDAAAKAAAAAQAASAAQPPVAPAAPPELPPAFVAATVPEAVRLTYKTTALVKGLPWSLDGELWWQHDGANYNAKLQWSATFVGTKTLTSSGQIGAGGLLPQRFSDKFRSSEVAAHFERDKQKITFSANTPDVPLLPGMQDQLSVFVQLGAMLAGAPTAYPKGTRISFETIGARSADTWVFVVEGEETLNLATGEVKAIKLVRPARGEYDQTAELWLAPQLGYLPARIKVSERNGDYVDQVWRGN